MKLLLAEWIYKHLGVNDGHPPGSECELDFGELEEDGRPMQIARTYNNDGFELWLGYWNKWHVFYQQEHARQLAWFILWDWWAKSTWFGLKRKIWYWALHQIVIISQDCRDKKHG